MQIAILLIPCYNEGGAIYEVVKSYQHVPNATGQRPIVLMIILIAILN